MENRHINRYLPWIVCFTASLFFAYELIQLHMLNAIAPMLLKDLSLSATQFGYLGATYLLADVIFLLPAGIILDRFSTRKVILTALLFCIVGTFLFSIANSFLVACLSHFLSGIGNAFCFLSCMILVSRWFEKERQALVIGLMITMGMLGAFLAQTPFSYLAQAFSWRQTLVLDGCIGLLIALLVVIFVRDHPSINIRSKEKTSSPSYFHSLKLAISNKQNIASGLYTGFMNLPLMVISAVWGSLFLVQVHQFSLTNASFIVSMIAMGTIVGSPFFGWFSDRIGQRRPLMIGGAFAAVLVFSAILLVPVSSYSLFLALFFLLGFVTSSQVLGYAIITESNHPSVTGISQGIAAVIIMGFAMIMQPFSGWLIDLQWNGQMLNGNPIYQYSDFVRSFMIFPVGFIASLFLSISIQEKTSLLEPE